MRPILKGGQWKNSEDEVLKAAVMKYGMNNWSRVASLLNRKTARQCRARWYEWLDPFVKKTPWSQQEDEKLLHAVKVFPTQWKTIAPIVGRTAYQCVARYNELLDIAAGGEPIAPENDPRLPKPGEIDAQPETRPAKADAVDLDDDEREMLAEARARLANTKGKKAKRKAREKQLEQKRRSVMVQRRKEFEEAGITLKPRRGRGSNVDYNSVIPNQMVPVLGAHDVSAEQSLSQEQEALHKRLQDIEMAKERLRQQKLRADERRLLRKIHPPSTERESVVDIFSIKQRSALTLPAPHATDSELLMIAEAAKNKSANNYFSDALLQSAAVKPHVEHHDSQSYIRHASQISGASRSMAVTEMSSCAQTDATQVRERIEPLNLAELLGDMNLYIGSKYGVQMGVDELEDRGASFVESDEETGSDRAVRAKVRQLSLIHRRYLMFVERLPRPSNLPATSEEIVRLLESNSEPLNAIEREINTQAANLLLADHLFLDPGEYQRIMGSGEGMADETLEKLKTAFLYHAHKASMVTNVKALKQAVIELDESLDDFSSLTPPGSGTPGGTIADDESDAESGSFSNADDLEAEADAAEVNWRGAGTLYDDLRTHISLDILKFPTNNSKGKVCLWNPAKKVHEFVPFTDPLIARSLQSQILDLQSAMKVNEKRNSKMLKRLDKLTFGYRRRVADAIATLDQVYEYDLEMYRNTIVPILPKPQNQLNT